MTTSLSNITVKDGTNTLIVKANDITINGSSILATNNFVTLDTNQDISGQKSFYASQHLNGSTLHINSTTKTLYPIQSHCRYSEIATNASIPTTTNVELGYDLFLATDGSMVTRLLPQILTNGKTVFRIQTRKTVDNIQKEVQITPTIESNGTAYIDTNGIVLGQSDNSTKLATTNWVQTMMHESSIQLKSTNIDKTTTVSTDTWANNYYINYDNNSSRTFFMQMRQFTNDAIGCRLCVQNGDPSSSTQYYTNLDLIAYKNQNSPVITSTAHFDINNYIAAITGPINFIAQNNSITPGSTPSSNQYVGYDFRGSNNTRLAYLGVRYLSNGTKDLELQKVHNDLTKFSMANWVTAHNQIVLGDNNTSASFAQIRMFNKAYTNGTPTSTSTQRYIEWYDASSTQLGFINLNVNTSEDRTLTIRSSGKTSSVSSQLSLQALASGSSLASFNCKVNLPTPATSSNEATAATTAYVNNKHQVVSALPASPDANVFYYIPA